MAKVALIGYSGHAFVVADIILSMQHTLVGYFDIDVKSINPYGLGYLGNESNPDDLAKAVDQGMLLALALGQNHMRRKAFEFFLRAKFNAITGIHPTAIISPKSGIGEGSMIMPGAIVNSMAVIGKGCIINSQAVIEHECSIGNFTHIAPSATLAGNVSVGDGAFVGANATVKQGIRIGNNAVVGAGTLVLNNIPDNETWAGVPARKISK